MKKFWRCHVCNDIHYGINPVVKCPTCNVENAYIEISSTEAKKIIDPVESKMDPDKFREAIKRLAENREFKVNPDTERIDLLIEGVFNCEKNQGFKYCPCRMIEKDFQKDLQLICPCNFLVHETYQGKDDGECWCGMFIKRRKNE